MAGLLMMRRMAPVAAVVAGMMLAGAARADEGITVQGNGMAKGKPSQVEIDCTISGDAELASDATVKFRDARKRAMAAIEALKNPDLKVISDGVAINAQPDAAAQQAMMQGRGGAAGKPKVMILEKNHIVLSNADKLETEALLETVLKILDVAKDAGFQIGPGTPSNYYEAQLSGMMGNAMVTFKVPDGVVLRDQAYKAAFDDAKTKAMKLAELSGVKLGKVLSIQEAGGTAAKNDMSGIPTYLVMAMMGMASKQGTGNTDEKAISSSTAGELIKRLSLTVQFEIVK